MSPVPAPRRSICPHSESRTHAAQALVQHLFRAQHPGCDHRAERRHPPYPKKHPSFTSQPSTRRVLATNGLFPRGMGRNRGEILPLPIYTCFKTRKMVIRPLLFRSSRLQKKTIGSLNLPYRDLTTVRVFLYMAVMLDSRYSLFSTELLYLWGTRKCMHHHRILTNILNVG